MSQESVVRALAEPSFYPDRPATVEHLQTHISHVFIAGPYAYKLKKAVRFPFLDFSTPELREHFCREEVRLNRRLCPSVYLGVLRVARGPDGVLRLDGPGATLEHLVWMRRLPGRGMLPELLAAGRVAPAMIEALAAELAAFHARAPAGPEVAAYASPAALRARWAKEVGAVAGFVGRLIAAEDQEVVSDFGPCFIERHTELLERRRAEGRIREGHGDLHARNLCYVETGNPELGSAPGLPPLEPGFYVFDCIEFSQEFRSNDVASEIAFLAMDLVGTGHDDLAGCLVRAYVARARDTELERLLPFYACYRAYVRGKVDALKSEEAEVGEAARGEAELSARRHFALSVRYAWSTTQPAIVACVGLSGTGKTTLAAALAEATGFAHLSTDELRRHGAPREAEPPRTGPGYGTGRYSAEARATVYRTLAAAADRAVAAGRAVVADATFIRRADRLRLAEVARARGCPLIFLECTAQEKTVRARLEARAREQSSRRAGGGFARSDARWETYLVQRDEREPLGADEPHIAVDTTAGVAAARAAALRALWKRQRRSGT